eukprot:5735890-Alexandrium_andersonii.AAC.1
MPEPPTERSPISGGARWIQSEAQQRWQRFKQLRQCARSSFSRSLSGGLPPPGPPRPISASGAGHRRRFQGESEGPVAPL